MRLADATVSVSVGGDEFTTAAPAAGPPTGLPSPGELPFTGTAAGLLTFIALVLIVAGMALIVLTQQRSPSHA